MLMIKYANQKGKISWIFMVLIAIILVPVVLLVINNIRAQNEYGRLKDEISRVSNTTGVQPNSVDCTSGSLADICHAEYENLSYQQAINMLTSSGYAVTYESPGIRIDAKNEATQTSVGVAIGSGSVPTVISYKDIDVTL